MNSTMISFQSNDSRNNLDDIKNPVQFQTHNLKLGKISKDAEFRRKTAYIGRHASRVSSGRSLLARVDTNIKNSNVSENKDFDKSPRSVTKLNAPLRKINQNLLKDLDMPGSSTNPVQVQTHNLKLGKISKDAEFRRKTAHIGRRASHISANLSRMATS